MEFGFRAKVHHIGVATADAEKTAEFYLAMGYHKVVGGYDPNQNVYGYFYAKEGSPMIELLAPYDEKSPINKILAKNGVTPYHLCYEVAEPIEEVIADLRRNRFMQLGKPTISDSLGGRRVCFFFNKDVGVIEILEHEAF